MSEKGPVATEAPSFAQPAIAISGESINAESLQADAQRAAATLKRAREVTPTSPSSAITTQLASEYSPTKVARIAHLASIRSPAPLTGAAALEDERRNQEELYRLQVSGATENPAYKVQADLMSAGVVGMSRPEDAPMTAENIPAVTIPTTTNEPSEPQMETSPTVTNLSGASGPVTESPAPMEIDPQLERTVYAPQPQAQMEEKENTSLSYPGLVSAATAASQMPAMSAPPLRGNSLPMTPGQQGTPKSPNSKKHKCPYCETEFTRHHNLKSHLLTHSQEKPYACNTCQMRFRRLHDLKRHSKLHTGEKPHICPKCDRKFARGDALARHSKGPGGCVSRRGSMFGDEDFQDSSHLDGDSAMSGMVYDGSNESDMTEEDRRRLSLPNPSIKPPHMHGSQTIPEGYAPTSRTYPPVAAAAAAGGRLFPPNVEHGSVSSTTSGVPPAIGNISLYSQTGMTESPQPLEPGKPHDSNTNRQRSPSLTTQFQQQHFGRQQTDRQTPPVPGFAASDGRFAAQGGASSAAANTQGAGAAVTSTAQTTSGPEQNGSSGDSGTNNLFATDQGVWVYVHNLEENIKELVARVATLEQSGRTNEERINQLTDEVTFLRSQTETRSDIPVPEPAMS